MAQGTQEIETHNIGAELNCTDEMPMVVESANTDKETGVGLTHQATDAGGKHYCNAQNLMCNLATDTASIGGEIQNLKHRVSEIEGELEKLQWDVKSSITCQVSTFHPQAHPFAQLTHQLVT
jgi:hypothetical protein